MSQKTMWNTLKKSYPEAKYYLNYKSRLELTIAAILSSQVRDEVVNSTTPILFSKYNTAKDYASADVKEIEKVISKITFFRNKAKNIIEACKIIEENHNGKVPSTLKELVNLPGIGKKTANAILINGFDKVEGVVVDTHVIRLSQRLGFSQNKNPNKIEEDLMKTFDKSEWKKIPWVLKDHGKEVCSSVPKCSMCIIKDQCPKAGVKNSK